MGQDHQKAESPCPKVRLVNRLQQATAFAKASIRINPTRNESFNKKIHIKKRLNNASMAETKVCSKKFNTLYDSGFR